MLNHDVVGEEDEADRRFVKDRRFKELTEPELEELDALAELLERDPTREQLVTFYRSSRTLRAEGAEADPYSFVFTP